MKKLSDKIEKNRKIDRCKKYKLTNKPQISKRNIRYWNDKCIKILKNNFSVNFKLTDKIVLDCANGVCYKAAPTSKELGAKVIW